MRLALLQSNYVPWKGYFDLIASSDLTVIYDTRQYTKNDWRNRNQVLIAGRLHWLTVPVKASGRFGQRICDTEVASPTWAVKHWKTIQQAYRRRPHFERYAESWEAAWRDAGDMQLLSDVNLRLLRQMLGDLGIATPVRRDTEIGELEPTLDDYDASASDVVLRICVLLGADEYVTGPAGLAYLDRDAFGDAGIAVITADYAGYPSYPQDAPEIVHRVSIVDLLANVGPEAMRFLAGDRWA